MKNFQAKWLVFAVVLGAIGCEGNGRPPPRPALELGLVWGTEAFISYEVLEYPADYTHRITSDHYEGETYIRVTRGYDFTDTSDAGHEHILWLQTSEDSEELSSWDDLRAVWSGTGGPEPFEYSVDLRFPAEVSSNPEPNNGILEIDPSRQDTLSVTWEYPAEDDALGTEFPLEKVD